LEPLVQLTAAAVAARRKELDVSGVVEDAAQEQYNYSSQENQYYDL
jgi:hypothetical protein